MRRNVPAKQGKRYLFVWVLLGFVVLVAASLAWSRSVISGSNILHNVGPDAPASPSSLVDLHAEIEVLRNQRDVAQKQAKQLTEQLSTVKNQLPDSTDLQQDTVAAVALPEDRHVPWAPSETRDQKSTNPELAAILRYDRILTRLLGWLTVCQPFYDVYMLQENRSQQRSSCCC